MDLDVKKNCAGLPDSHLHTKFSFDSKLEPSAHAEDAVQLGICAITLTDHVDIVTESMVLDEGNHCDTWNDGTVLGSVAAAREMNGRYPGLEVLAGVELGQAIAPGAEVQAEHVLSLADFDFVLGSMHLMRSGPDYYYIDYTLPENDPYDIYAEYLDDILALVRWGRFDCLAHLTYPLRYIIGQSGVDFDERRFDGTYDRILKTLADSGKALEINTSGARRVNGFMLPDTRLVARFRELGGRYITLGSDAHRKGHIGAGLDIGAEMAREAGFDSVVYYREHKPVAVLI